MERLALDRDVQELAAHIARHIAAVKQDLTDVGDLVGNPSDVSEGSTNMADAVNEAIGKAVADLIGGADEGSNTLKELADKIAALAQADNGLVSAAEAQNFSESQKKQARDNIDAVSTAELKDATDQVAGTYATKQELTKAITDLINGADVDSDTLKELADKITALAQADNGLVSAVEAQDFNASQQKQARDNISAIAEEDLEFGDGYVDVFQAALDEAMNASEG